MAIFQDIRPRQSSLRVAAGENRLQVHLQQEVYRSGLSDVAPTQPGTVCARTEIKTTLVYHTPQKKMFVTAGGEIYM